MNETIAKTMTYGGGSTALIFGWDANSLAAVGGILIGLAGLFLTWYYKRQQSKRQQNQDARDREWHEKRMGQGE